MRFRSRLLTFLAATLMLTGLTSAVTTTAAQADPCRAGVICGEVKNETNRTLYARYKDDDSGPWQVRALAPGQKLGGCSSPLSCLDIDQVEIPAGCVARVSVGGNERYFPMGWDRFSSGAYVRVLELKCRDGRVYAWENIWNDENNGGLSCSWPEDDYNWGDNCGNFRNRASAVQNNGSTTYNNAINLYYHTDHTGAWACLGPASVWRDLRWNYFSWGAGRDGYTYAINDEIASSKWVRTCGTP
ncbi:hypothetical protein [Actinokineospora sp. NBRC 105648]|uniref:hypothetical protein n=1 Tax=Actinokineospora sp. NBRC 105648 TaxID=3032206 RepID=UPI0024A471E9|nr:hypothetical protein [Actinokineospora sp. NBRC 105648]GLZ38005.1 hypothetical protein Acsp05_16290 [Actinokineospora sp. NBRC 105648]